MYCSDLWGMNPQRFLSICFDSVIFVPLAEVVRSQLAEVLL